MNLQSLVRKRHWEMPVDWIALSTLRVRQKLPCKIGLISVGRVRNHWKVNHLCWRKQPLSICSRTQITLKWYCSSNVFQAHHRKPLSRKPNQPNRSDRWQLLPILLFFLNTRKYLMNYCYSQWSAGNKTFNNKQILTNEFA